MLQAMQKKVSEEGEKEQELYDKFLCYCKKGSSNLTASVASAGTKISTVTSDIKEAEDLAAETKEILGSAQTDRAAAKEAMAEATAIREKEAAAYAATLAESTANIGALKKA